MNDGGAPHITFPPARRIAWRELSFDCQNSLAGKLNGLYGRAESSEAFDALEIDKRQALLLLHFRLNAHGLWNAVRRIENVWGAGGVGMNFRAFPFLASTLRRHVAFTTFMARHRSMTGGFYERIRTTAVLHFLFADDDESRFDANARRWSVHFDLNSPVASPLSAFRHLRRELFGGFVPDWRDVRAALELTRHR